MSEREWAKDVIRSLPAVHIVNTDYVPTFKRRPDACIDRAAALLALEHAARDRPGLDVLMSLLTNIEYLMGDADESGDIGQRVQAALDYLEARQREGADITFADGSTADFKTEEDRGPIPDATEPAL